MAEVTVTVYQNEYLPVGGTDVNAIVSISANQVGRAGQAGAAGEIIMVDTSASMGETKLAAAKAAAKAAVDEIIDGTYFAVVAGTHRAFLAYPAVQQGAGMFIASPLTKNEAKRAIDNFRAMGGTAMGTWLTLAKALFDSVPEVVQKHAILLTDGENHNETTSQLDYAIYNCLGSFQCDCRGIGTDWKVSELRKISQSLIGTVGLIPSPDLLPEEFSKLMNQAMDRGLNDLYLRVWCPVGAQILFVRQVSPELLDLTNRSKQVNSLTVDFPTGAWGEEIRDYQVAVRLPAKLVGQEQLAARVQLISGNEILSQGLVKAKWSSDLELTAGQNVQVRHYAAQAEMSMAIQAGLLAKEQGDETTATAKLGRAVQLAAQIGNTEATTKLRKLVEIDDIDTGSVRLKRKVDKADEMELDTFSTKTTRIKK